MLNGRLAKTLVCANGKGGVGKTSLTAGIGAYSGPSRSVCCLWIWIRRGT